MFLNKFLLIGGGIAVAGTGTGLGIYYGTKGGDEGSKEKVKGDHDGKKEDAGKEKLKEPVVALGNVNEKNTLLMPRGDDQTPETPLRLKGN